MRTDDVWPAGATWVFQGTVAEDATVGTHVSTLTVTPGAGSEMILVGGMITDGNTATAQTPVAFIDDGTNELIRLVNPNNNTISVASQQLAFPQTGTGVGTDVTANALSQPFVISGTMRLILKVTTTAVSVTQTFAIICRIKGGTLPTATLADAVGVPTLTTNTNKTF